MSDYFKNNVDYYNKLVDDILDCEKDKEFYQKMLTSIANEEEEKEKQFEQKIEAIDKEIDDLNFKKSNLSTIL